MSYNLKIDINADVGEGLGNETNLMPYLSSCNIACGGHAGDFVTMRKVARLAQKHKVKIGAHPSFPDRENFGREVLDISALDLFDSIMCQVIDLHNIVKQKGIKLNHIKPHGALYNLAAKDESTAEVILNVIEAFPEPLKLYAPYTSVISKLAKSRQIEVVFEGFADRNYNEDLSLVSRQKSNALITKKEIVFEHIFRMIYNQKVRSINGVEVPLFVDTICVHGDTENAIEILAYLYKEMKRNKVEII